MTTANAAIANHLNIVESAIAAVEEWAHVLFVKFVSGRPRFVSKRVIETMNTTNLFEVETGYSTEYMDAENQFQSTIMIMKYHKDAVFTALAKVGSIFQSAGNFPSLEMAASAAFAKYNHEIKASKAKESMSNAAFVASSGMMETSTGEWVTADEWDAIEGGM